MSDASTDKTVFISYRRNVASFIARAIFQDLRANDYDVFMDVESIDSGTFDTIILNQIAARAHFLVILTPGTLERCNEAGDWLRREVEYAIASGRNIVPIFVNDFRFKDAGLHLTGKLSELSRFNALSLPHDYFDEAMLKLRKRYLRQTLQGIIQPTPLRETFVVNQKIEEAVRLPLLTEEEWKSQALIYEASQKELGGDLDGAIKIYDELIQMNPDNDTNLCERGSLYAAKGDILSALSDYSAAIHLNPYEAGYFLNRGLVYYDVENWIVAAENFREAIHLRPNYAEAFSNLGNSLISLQDWDQALKELDTAIQFNPNLVPAYNNRGIVFRSKRDYDSAIANFTQAIAIDPSFIEAYRNRADTRFLKKDYHGSIEDYSQVIRINSKDSDAYYNRGGVKGNIGDIKGEIADYTVAITLDPNNEDIYSDRAITLYRSRDLNGAFADTDQVIKINENNKTAYSIRGEIFFERKQYAMALLDFQKLNKLEPGQNDVMASLAITYHATHDLRTAVRLWRLLLAVNQNFRDPEWVKKELSWADPLVDEARKLIAKL
jgi:tetratricopeptide (TPR) repeat protein